MLYIRRALVFVIASECEVLGQSKACFLGGRGGACFMTSVKAPPSKELLPRMALCGNTNISPANMEKPPQTILERLQRLCVAGIVRVSGHVSGWLGQSYRVFCTEDRMPIYTTINGPKREQIHDSC